MRVDRTQCHCRSARGDTIAREEMRWRVARSLEELSLGLPWGEEVHVDGADGLAGAIVVTSVPLGLSVAGQLLDLSEVWLDGSDGLDLPVWVVLGSDDNFLLSSVGIVDSLVLRVIVASAGVLDGLWLELLNSFLDSVKVTSLDSSDESIGVIGEGLVRREASVELGSEVLAQEGVEDTGLEVSWGGGGNSVLGFVDSKGSSGEHLFRFFKKNKYYYNFKRIKVTSIFVD